MKWFGIERIIKLGGKSLWMHRLRSTLTMLGIVFGVASVIAMLAIGEGASKETQDAIARLGSTNLIIETIRPPEKQASSSQTQGASSYGLTYNDAEIIRNTISNVEVTVPIREIDHKARYHNREISVKIVGTIPWYLETSPVRMIRGRFLSSTDLRYQLSVCIVDEALVRDLFVFDDPLGKDIRMQGSYYRVIGIASDLPATGNGNNGFGNDVTSAPRNAAGAAGNIYIPLTTAKSRFVEINATFSGGSRQIEKVELQKIMVKVNSAEQVIPIRDVLEKLLDRVHEKEDYHIVVPLELLRQAARMTRVFTIVLGSIAAISLLVGGIGIMNIMLASVSERTREIGIRRALGAKKRDIIIQFLTETVMLTLIGGVLGLAFGTIIPSLVTYFGHMPTVITTWSLVLSFGISGVIGIVFGLYPAWRAANMDPIESLRHE